MNQRTVNLTQRRLLSPTFAFTRELVNGRIRGLEAMRMTGPLKFRHDLKAEDLKVTDAMFKAFRDFVAADPGFKITTAMVDRHRAFIELEMRTNLVTAAHGRVIGDRVFIMSTDPQVAKAVDVLPRARELSQR